MAINFKRKTINGKMYNVVDMESYMKNNDIYNKSQTAIEVTIGEDNYVLPFRNKTDNKPGIYEDGSIEFFYVPEKNNEKEFKEYSSDNMLDFSKCTNIVEIMKKQKILRDEEKEILANPDNIFIPPISGKESPAMLGLKQAVIEKHIDIDKYQDRFGRENFPNDKRKFKDDDITMFMMNRMNKALDIKATLILEDKSPDVPNPMGKKISIDLTGYDED